MAELTQDQVRMVFTDGGPRRWTLFALLDVSGNDTIDMADLGFFRRVTQVVVMNCTAAPGPLNTSNIIDAATIQLPPGLSHDSGYMLVDGVSM